MILSASRVEHQPGPAAGEMADRLLLQFGEQCVEIAEPVLDHRRELARRLLALGRRQALPEEIVVPELGGIVEQALGALLLRGADHLAERAALEPDLLGQRVGLVDIGLVVLAMMKVERLGRHEAAERVLGERKVGKGERHGRSPAKVGLDRKPTNARLVQRNRSVQFATFSAARPGNAADRPAAPPNWGRARWPSGSPDRPRGHCRALRSPSPAHNGRSPAAAYCAPARR